MLISLHPATRDLRQPDQGRPTPTAISIQPGWAKSGRGHTRRERV